MPRDISISKQPAVAAAVLHAKEAFSLMDFFPFLSS